MDGKLVPRTQTMCRHGTREPPEANLQSTTGLGAVLSQPPSDLAAQLLLLRRVRPACLLKLGFHGLLQRLASELCALDASGCRLKLPRLPDELLQQGVARAPRAQQS